jgi:hypothetical protein
MTPARPTAARTPQAGPELPTAAAPATWAWFAQTVPPRRPVLLVGRAVSRRLVAWSDRLRAVRQAHPGNRHRRRAAGHEADHPGTAAPGTGQGSRLWGPCPAPGATALPRRAHEP